MAGIPGSAEHPAELQNAPSLAQLKEGLLLSYAQCSERGLIHSANWLVRSSTSYLRVYFSGYYDESRPLIGQTDFALHMAPPLDAEQLITLEERL